MLPLTNGTYLKSVCRMKNFSNNYADILIVDIGLAKKERQNHIGSNGVIQKPSL